MPIVLIWCRNMLLPAHRRTPMSAMALTMYGASVMWASVCSMFSGSMLIVGGSSGLARWP
jgi:hypothetical protein